MTSHFSGLKAISHSLSQDSRMVRSDCSLCENFNGKVHDGVVGEQPDVAFY